MIKILKKALLMLQNGFKVAMNLIKTIYNRVKIAFK